MRTALAALARPAARAVRIRRTGPASPSRTTRRSISFRNNSSTTDCRECAVTATAVPRYQARSGLRPHAGSTQCGLKSAEPACPAMSNAAWRESGMGWRCWLEPLNGSSPRTRGPIPRDLSRDHWRQTSRENNERPGLWVPAFAGRSCVLTRSRLARNLLHRARPRPARRCSAAWSKA